MRIGQANLGRGVGVREFTRNLIRVLDAGEKAIICLQEIDEADAPDEHAIMRRLATDTHVIACPRDAVPILVPKHLPIMRQTSTLGAKGLARYTPHRPISEVTVQLDDGLLLTVLNFHLPINRLATQTRRAQVRTVAAARIKARQAQGDAVAWCSDTNTHGRFPTLGKREVSVINAGIDKTRAMPPRKYTAEVSGVRRVDLTIDGHDAHFARVIFERKGK